MKLFNTMSRKKEEFTPMDANNIRIYACGPTVYNFIHVGNARPIIMFDALRRYLEYRGYKVSFMQNFTDIDDKVIKSAAAEGVTFSELAERYIGEYYTDVHGLNVRDADISPRATEHIGSIIGLIEKLIEKGYAYQAGGDVYFDTASFPGYGKLSGQPLNELEAGARVEPGEVKRAPMDFALWKAAKEGEPSWRSPWGEGRPGWHIECSAMVGHNFGPTADIHCGGQDLIFPHHENEVAQSEAANGLPLANYWLHNGFLSIDNKKMSKSLGNFFTVRDAAAAYGYEPIRFFMLSAHYRSPLNYSGESLMQAKSALERMYTAVRNLEYLAQNSKNEHTSGGEAFVNLLVKYRERFVEAMDDDFNTADALGVIFEMIRDINTETATDKKPSAELARRCHEAVLELTDVLGLLYVKDESALDAEIEKLIEARVAARREKNFKEADRIRDLLKDQGIILEDTPDGVKWKRADNNENTGA